ncbi:response regulator [Flavobacterium luteolum]|uniref:response regulator n=1 Tax=Flavobacterium luteolum TaxID=3003259 RepID=UPI00248DA4CD|nr:response regulator [Flavobacterium luteolum]
MPLNILIVDDHPMTVDSYINLLSEDFFEISKPHFIKCYNCEDAYKKITLLSMQNVKIDFAIVDVNLPPYNKYNISNGLDLSTLIRKTHLECKILILTMRTEAFLVDKIIKRIKPEGFVSKSEINFELFPLLCKKIISGEIFYSSEIMKSHKELLKENIKWDEHDTQILILLSQGVKTIKLTDHIPLSMSAIEKRKANIKSQLLMGKGSDADLIRKAKKMGFL